MPLYLSTRRLLILQKKKTIFTQNIYEESVCVSEGETESPHFTTKVTLEIHILIGESISVNLITRRWWNWNTHSLINKPTPQNEKSPYTFIYLIIYYVGNHGYYRLPRSVWRNINYIIIYLIK